MVKDAGRIGLSGCELSSESSRTEQDQGLRDPEIHGYLLPGLLNWPEGQKPHSGD